MCVRARVCVYTDAGDGVGGWGVMNAAPYVLQLVSTHSHQLSFVLQRPFEVLSFLRHSESPQTMFRILKM